MLLIFTLGFLPGIAFASHFLLSWMTYAALSAVAILALCLFNRFVPLIILVLGFLFGCLRYEAFFPPGWNIASFGGAAPISIYGTIVTDPAIDPNKASFLLRTDEVKTHSGTYLVRGTTEVLVHGAALPLAENVRFGDHLLVAGLLQDIFPATNPGQFDYRSRLAHRGVSGELVVKRPDGVVIVARAGPFSTWEDWADRAQQRCDQIFKANLPTDEAGLLSGILFGERRSLSPDLQRQFAETGTAHVLATAGLHIAILALCLTALFNLLPISRKAASVVIILLLWAFAAAAGGRAAVIRAVVTATIYFSARVFERVPDLPTSLSAAALTLVTVQPLDLFDSDFQMSFVTVTGLVLFLPYWDNLWRGRVAALPAGAPKWLVSKTVDLLGLSIVAQACAAPLTVYYFNQLSLLSLPVNCVVVPLLFAIIPAAAIALLACLCLPAAGRVLAHYVLHPLLWSVLHTVSFFAGLPLCWIAVATPPALAIVGVYLVTYGISLGYNLRPQRTVRSQDDVGAVP